MISFQQSAAANGINPQLVDLSCVCLTDEAMTPLLGEEALADETHTHTHMHISSKIYIHWKIQPDTVFLFFRHSCSLQTATTALYTHARTHVRAHTQTHTQTHNTHIPELRPYRLKESTLMKSRGKKGKDLCEE